VEADTTETKEEESTTQTKDITMADKYKSMKRDLCGVVTGICILAALVYLIWRLA
jgi:hypothetical protein